MRHEPRLSFYDGYGLFGTGEEVHRHRDRREGWSCTFRLRRQTRQKTPVDDRRGKLRCATSVHVMKNKKVFMRSPHEGMFLLRMSKRQGELFHLLALIRHAVQQACGGSSGAGGQWRVEQTGGQLLCLWTEQPAQHAHRLLCLMI